MVTVGSVVSSATAFRIGVACLDLWARRTPPMVRLAASASFAGSGTRRAQAEFRDEAIALARESAEIYWRELRRGVDDLDSLTRPRHEPGARPHRPYRVKL